MFNVEFCLTNVRKERISRCSIFVQNFQWFMAQTRNNNDTIWISVAIRILTYYIHIIPRKNTGKFKNSFHFFSETSVVTNHIVFASEHYHAVNLSWYEELMQKNLAKEHNIYNERSPILSWYLYWSHLAFICSLCWVSDLFQHVIFWSTIYDWACTWRRHTKSSTSQYALSNPARRHEYKFPPILAEGSNFLRTPREVERNYSTREDYVDNRTL